MGQVLKFLSAAAVVSTLVLTGCRTTKEAFQLGDAADSNPGPCPRAFALYEAARIVEFRGEKQTFKNVGFTGEIGKIRSLCRYYGEQPIVGDIDITFELGRGPAAEEQETAVYEYFVAVTRKNIAVINKETFPLQVTFPAGKDRVTVTERIREYKIPRASEGTSGENFEIVVGFNVTPEQREFNAQGKRFRVSAGQK